MPHWRDLEKNIWCTIQCPAWIRKFWNAYIFSELHVGGYALIVSWSALPLRPNNYMLVSFYFMAPAFNQKGRCRSFFDIATWLNDKIKATIFKKFGSKQSVSKLDLIELYPIFFMLNMSFILVSIVKTCPRWHKFCVDKHANVFLMSNMPRITHLRFYAGACTIYSLSSNNNLIFYQLFLYSFFFSALATHFDGLTLKKKKLSLMILYIF